MIALTRRTVLAGLTTLAAIPARPDPAWPSRPITLVHGYVAGGATDVVARILAEGLTRRLGQQVLVDPRPGASGTAAAGQVARAVPDGHTLIAIPGGHATAEALYKKLPYKTIDDFSMISMVSEYPFVFVTHADHKIQTAVDLIRAARSQNTSAVWYPRNRIGAPSRNRADGQDGKRSISARSISRRCAGRYRPSRQAN
jgi:tripartite-type tricarboxylate transporter receptor subunit TctC